MNLKTICTVLLCLLAGRQCLLAADGGELHFNLPAAIGSHDEAASRIELRGRDARWQLQVSHSLASSTASDADAPIISRDVTQQVAFSVEPAEIAQVDASGFVTPLTSGSATITAALDGQAAISLAVDVTGMETNQPVHFANQIVPIFTKIG